jgi:transcription antitermination protein NusB
MYCCSIFLCLYTTKIVLITMLNRHHLRVKALHGLYAQFSAPEFDIILGEKELQRSIDKYYELYVYQLSLFGELFRIAERIIDDGKQKLLPTRDDLNPNTKFIDNLPLRMLVSNAELTTKIQQYKISWRDEHETLRKLFNKIRLSDTYKNYMEKSSNYFSDAKRFIIDIYAEFIANNEYFEDYYEGISIHWLDDFYMVNSSVVKTIESLQESSTNSLRLQPLYKDAVDDKRFVFELFRRVLLRNQELEQLIGDKTQNWELERIANMDILLMRMAIVELTFFNEIPVKVTLNEYIELSKEYSTDKSKNFVNGILDKLVVELKASGAIAKTGRGLLE